MISLVVLVVAAYLVASVVGKAEADGSSDIGKNKRMQIYVKYCVLVINQIRAKKMKHRTPIWMRVIEQLQEEPRRVWSKWYPQKLLLATSFWIQPMFDISDSGVWLDVYELEYTFRIPLCSTDKMVYEHL